MLIKANDTYYVFNLKGYSAVGDYRKGLKIGFMNGGDYYDSVALGLPNNELYTFYTRNNFASIEDCKKAFANGFAREKETPPVAVLPLEISVDRVKFLSQYIPVLAVYISVYRLEGNIYKLSHTREMILNGDAGYEKIKEIVQSRDKSAKPPELKARESQAFYWAEVNGISKYDDYLKFIATITGVVAEGYRSVKDQETGISNGFTDGDIFYEAKENGFENAEDFRLAGEFGVRTFEQYKTIKAIADGINSIMKKDSKTFPDSAFIYLLTSIPRGKSYSIPSIAEYLMKNVISPECQKYLHRKRVECTENNLKAFLMANPTLSIGKWDAEGGVFVRN